MVKWSHMLSTIFFVPLQFRPNLCINTPIKGRKQKEKRREGKERRKKFSCQIVKIENKEIKAKLEEIAKLLYEKNAEAIGKTERKRLVSVAEIVFDKLLDIEPICENLAGLLKVSREMANVKLVANE